MGSAFGQVLPCLARFFNFVSSLEEVGGEYGIGVGNTAFLLEVGDALHTFCRRQSEFPLGFVCRRFLGRGFEGLAPSMP